uniref:Uncharacterized protein n=1 Tax=Arundo donax TaxID=35708 RepID=A0A0A9C989_ARUDO
MFFTANSKTETSNLKCNISAKNGWHIFNTLLCKLKI